MDKYLVTYTLDGEPLAHTASMSQIADLVGMSDCTGATGFRCYRLKAKNDGYVDLERVNVSDRFYVDHDDGKWKNAGCMVFLTDLETGEIIDSAEYPDH